MLSALRDRAFYNRILAIAIPISLQQLITFGVNLMDNIMVGRFGESMLAATSLVGSFYQLFSAMSMGIGCGAVVITAQYWGKRDTDAIRKMTSIALKASALLSLLFFLASLLFPAFIMRIYTDDPGVIAEGIKYLRIMAYCFLVHSSTLTVTQILRSVGFVRVPLYATIGSFFVNIFFNYIFIFGKLGAPCLEIRGAALGTLIARVFEFVIIVGYFLFRDRIIGFRLRHLLGFDRTIFRKYVKAGLPVLISDTIMIIGLNLTAVIIGHTGSEFTSANSISMMINHLVTALFSGVSNASSVLTGNMIGEGDHQKTYRYGIGFLVVGVLFGIFGGIVLFVIKTPIISIYSVTENTARYTTQILTIVSCIMPVLMLDQLLTKGILRGGGDTKFLIVGDTLFAYVLAAPLGYLAAFVWNLPVWVIFIMLRSDSVAKCAVCLWRFFSKRWLKDVTVKGGDVKQVSL